MTEPTETVTPPLVCRPCEQHHHALCSVWISNADVEGRCSCSHNEPVAAAGHTGDESLRPVSHGFLDRMREKLPAGVGGPPENDEDWVREAMQARVQHQREADEERWAAVCPVAFRGVGWDVLAQDQPDSVVAELRAWEAAAVAKPATEHANLLVLGPLGVGKTLASLLVARAFHDVGRVVRFWPMGEMLEGLRPDGGLDLSELTTPDVLVLDDVGAEKPSEWTADRVYMIVNRRWLDALPTIVTTNFEPDDVRERIGERTWDRFLHGTTAVRLVGASHRRPA